MGMGNFNKDKFVFKEIFLNESGKTSGSSFIGVIMGMVGCLSFIAAIIGYFMKLENTIDFMQQTIFFIGSATVLLGIRKMSEAKTSVSGLTSSNKQVENDV